MQTTTQFLASLYARCFTLCADCTRLFVEPRTELTPQDVARIQAEKLDLLWLLEENEPKPELTADGLRFPFFCAPKWRWWAEGQSLAQTLADLDAPAAVIRRYLGKSDAPLHTALGVQDCKGKDGGIVAIDGIEFCTVCGWFYETPAVNELADYLGF